MRGCGGEVLHSRNCCTIAPNMEQLFECRQRLAWDVKYFFKITSLWCFVVFCNIYLLPGLRLVFELNTIRISEFKQFLRYKNISVRQRESIHSIASNLGSVIKADSVSHRLLCLQSWFRFLWLFKTIFAYHLYL